MRTTQFNYTVTWWQFVKQIPCCWVCMTMEQQSDAGGFACQSASSVRWSTRGSVWKLSRVNNSTVCLQNLQTVRMALGLLANSPSCQTCPFSPTRFQHAVVAFVTSNNDKLCGWQMIPTDTWVWANNKGRQSSKKHCNLRVMMILADCEQHMCPHSDRQTQCLV